MDGLPDTSEGVSEQVESFQNVERDREGEERPIFLKRILSSL